MKWGEELNESSIQISVWEHTFGSSGGVWEGMYIPLGLPVVDMEFDPVTVMVIGWLMHSVAGSNANLHCFEKMSW